jgi:hypothetical protein
MFQLEVEWKKSEQNLFSILPLKRIPSIYLKTLIFLNLLPPSNPIEWNIPKLINWNEFLFLKFHFPKNFMIQFQFKCFQYLFNYWNKEMESEPMEEKVNWMSLKNGLNGKLVKELIHDPLLFIPTTTPPPLLKEWEEYFLIQKKEEILMDRIEYEGKKEMIPSPFPIPIMRKDTREYYPFEYLLLKQPHSLDKYEFKREKKEMEEGWTFYEDIIISSIEEQELSLDSLSYLFHHVFHPMNEVPSQLLNYLCVWMSVEIREEFPSLLYRHLRMNYPQWEKKKMNLFNKEVSILYFISMNVCSSVLDILQKRESMISFIPLLMERNILESKVISLQVISLLQSLILEKDMEGVEMMKFLKNQTMPESIWKDSMEYLWLEMTNRIFSHPWKEKKISWLEYSNILMDMCNTMDNGSMKYYVLQVAKILKSVEEGGRIKYHPIMNIHVLEELFHSISFKVYYYTLGELYFKNKE